MSNNPFLKFTPRELRAFKPFISKLNKYYNIHGIELDFERAMEGSLENIILDVEDEIDTLVKELREDKIEHSQFVRKRDNLVRHGWERLRDIAVLLGVRRDES